MKGLFQDLRYGVRALMKRPGVTLVAVITLALGIGANTTTFSTVNAMLLRPFAFPQLDRVVTISETVPKNNETHAKASPANFQDWLEQGRDLESMAAFHGWDANLSDGTRAEHVEAAQVTADFFSVLGMQPHAGRHIGRADFENGVSPVIVLGYQFWQRHLDSDPAIVGKTLMLNGKKYTVVGVGAEDLNFPSGVQIWTPLDLSGAAKADRENHYLTVIGRLKDRVSQAQAQAGLDTIAARLAQQYPNANAGHGVQMRTLVEDLTADSRQVLSVLMGAAIFVLLLACANVANLQLVRASSRQKEMALRAALGASRWHVVRQLFIESLLVAMLGGVAALVLSSWSLRLMVRGIPAYIVEHVAGLKYLQLDFRVFVFTLVAAVATGILAGLAPALHFSRPEINHTLKEGVRGGSSTGGRNRLRALLVVSEIALSLVLLVGAGLMVKGFRAIISSNMGFDRNHVLTFHVALPADKYKQPETIRGYYERALSNLKGLPGVESAAAVTSLPSGWSWNWSPYTAEGHPRTSSAEMATAISQMVSPEFFSTLRVSLQQGRLLSDEDRADSAPVAVISQTLAQQNWPNQNPIGKHIQMGTPESGEPQRRIVGVVADVQPVPLDHNPAPTVYVPIAQQPQLASAFVVRTSGDPLALASAVNTQIRSVDSEQPAFDVRTLDQVLSDTMSGIEQSARLMQIFGFCALILAAAGIYAVMAYSVAQRTHEMGLRMALGAQRGDVLKLVFVYAMKIAGIGLGIGLLLAFLLARVVSSALFGVVQIDVPTFVAFTFLLTLVTAFAVFIPAQRATRVDPMVALRYE